MVVSDARRAAEKELAARDLREQGVNQFAGEALEEDVDHRRRRRHVDQDGLEGDEGQEPAIPDFEVNLEAIDCPLREWIAQDRIRREVKKRFELFLKTFKVKGGGVGRGFSAGEAASMQRRCIAAPHKSLLLPPPARGGGGAAGVAERRRTVGWFTRPGSSTCAPTTWRPSRSATST